MAKRGAGSELNHDNWDQDDVREDAGMFQAASADTMKGRVIKRARRRNAGDAGGEEGKKNVFSAFGGFAGAKSEAPATSAAFSFLAAKPAADAPVTDKPSFGSFSFGAKTTAPAAPTPAGAFSFGAAAPTSTDSSGGGETAPSFSLSLIHI